MHGCLQETAKARLFTGWGSIAWCAGDRQRWERALLSHCCLQPIQDGSPHPRAVLHGPSLLAAMFGATVSQDTADSLADKWELLVVPRMARSCTAGVTELVRSQCPRCTVQFLNMDGDKVVVHPLRKEIQEAIDRHEGSGAEMCRVHRVKGPTLATDDRDVDRGVKRKGPEAHNVLGPIFGAEVGCTLQLALWNTQGFGRMLADGHRATQFRSWMERVTPDILIMPEAALPGGQFKRSKGYIELAEAEAAAQGCQLYWSSHYTGQARMGLAVMVRSCLVVMEVQYGLDPGCLQQWEGRVIALRFSRFWLLCLYVPHNQDDWRHLLAQASAWMHRQELPVLLAADLVEEVVWIGYVR